MVPLGRLRHWIKLLERETHTDTAGGSHERRMTTFARVAAEVEAVRGTERLAMAQLLVSESVQRITMRFTHTLLTEIAPTMRVLWRRTILEVLTPPADPTGRRQVLVCDAVVRAQNIGAFAAHAFDSTAFDVDGEPLVYGGFAAHAFDNAAFNVGDRG